MFNKDTTELDTTERCTCQKSWVQIPSEAAHFSLKKGGWAVSGAVVLFVICTA